MQGNRKGSPITVLFESKKIMERNPTNVKMLSNNSKKRLSSESHFTLSSKKSKRNTPAPFEIYEDETATLERPVRTLEENIDLFRAGFHICMQECEKDYVKIVAFWLAKQEVEWSERLLVALQSQAIAKDHLRLLISWKDRLNEKMNGLLNLTDLDDLYDLIEDLKEELRNAEELSAGQYSLSLQPIEPDERSEFYTAIISEYYLEAGFGIDVMKDKTWYSSRGILWGRIMQEHLGIDLKEARLKSVEERQELSDQLSDNMMGDAETRFGVDMWKLRESGWLDQCPWIKEGRGLLKALKNPRPSFGWLYEIDDLVD